MRGTSQTITSDILSKFKRTAKEGEQLHDKDGLFYLKQKNGGAWRLNYKSPEGKRKRITLFKNSDDISPKEARIEAGAWLADLLNGIDRHADKKAKQKQAEKSAKQRCQLVLGTFFEDIYVPHLKNFSTEAASLNIIKSNFGHLFDREMDTLEATDIRAWENKRKAEGIKRTTLVRAYGAFKAMLNFAAGEKKSDSNDAPVLQANPLKNVHLSKPTVKDIEAKDAATNEMNLKRDLLGAKERQKILNALDTFAEIHRQKRQNSRAHGKSYLADRDYLTYPHWFIPFCHIARLTGMRPGDIRTRKWSDIQVDFRTGTKILSFKPNKTKHHPNPILINFPITGELEGILSTWREQQGNPTSGFMFPSERTNKGIDKKAYQRHWKKIKGLAGINPEIEFYCYRHNFISDLANRNVSPLKIAKLVGHKNTDMIVKHYFKEDLEDLTSILMACSADSQTARPYQKEDQDV